MDWRAHTGIDAGVLGGKPVVKGTRLAVDVDDAGPLALLKVALHGVPDALLKSLESVGLREDRLPELVATSPGAWPLSGGLLPRAFAGRAIQATNRTVDFRIIRRL